MGIKWTIVKRAAAYTSGAKRCNLCLEEKLYIMKVRLKNLNKRSDIISKCRHRNRFLFSKTNHTKTIAMNHPTPANHDVNEQKKRSQWIDAVSVAWRLHPRKTRSSNQSKITLYLSSAPHGIEHSWIHRKHYHLSLCIYVYMYKFICKVTRMVFQFRHQPSPIEIAYVSLLLENLKNYDVNFNDASFETKEFIIQNKENK